MNKVLCEVPRHEAVYGMVAATTLCASLVLIAISAPEITSMQIVLGSMYGIGLLVSLPMLIVEGGTILLTSDYDWMMTVHSDHRPSHPAWVLGFGAVWLLFGVGLALLMQISGKPAGPAAWMAVTLFCASAVYSAHCYFMAREERELIQAMKALIAAAEDHS